MGSEWAQGVLGVPGVPSPAQPGAPFPFLGGAARLSRELIGISKANCNRDSEQGRMRISCLSSAFLFISKCQHSALQVLIGRHLLLPAAELVKEGMRMRGGGGRGIIECGCRDSRGRRDSRGSRTEGQQGQQLCNVLMAGPEEQQDLLPLTKSCRAKLQ